MFKKAHKLLAWAVMGTMLMSTPSFAKADTGGSSAKNVILFIADGASVDGLTLTRWYNDNKNFSFDPYYCGLVRTNSADAAIADSAPAGTAFATGYKSHTGYIGVLPDERTMPGEAVLKEEDKKRPIANVLEAAKSVNKSTGIVATSEIMHATPADFSAHYPDRKAYDTLSEQQVYMNMDVVLGSGEFYLGVEGRKDKEDLVSQIKGLGYDYVTDIAAMNTSKSSKLWGMFAPKDLSYEFDRDKSKQPSLADMTTKAVEVLSKDKDGFFLMVEGSKVDWAAHSNDPIGVISDILSFDAAVKVGMDYANSHKDTVVIVTTDHGNGGLSMGAASTNSGYDKLPLSSYLDPLKKATLTGAGVESKLSEDRGNAVEVMKTYYGISDLTAEELKAIKEAKAGTLNAVVGPMISKRANIGWTTTGHTGEDVFLAVYAPDGKRPTGLVDNTEIGKYIANTLKVDLDKLTSKLFVEAQTGFAKSGAVVTLDQTDKENLVVIVKKGSTEIKMPVNKNIAYVNGAMQILSGVVVYNGINMYVPQDAIALVK